MPRLNKQRGWLLGFAKEDVPWGRMNEWKARAEGERNGNQQGRGRERKRGVGKGKHSGDREFCLPAGGFGCLTPARRVHDGWLFSHSQHHPEAREGFTSCGGKLLREKQEPRSPPEAGLD